MKGGLLLVHKEESISKRIAVVFESVNTVVDFVADRDCRRLSSHSFVGRCRTAPIWCGCSRSRLGRLSDRVRALRSIRQPGELLRFVFYRLYPKFNHQPSPGWLFPLTLTRPWLNKGNNFFRAIEYWLVCRDNSAEIAHECVDNCGGSPCRP